MPDKSQAYSPADEPTPGRDVRAAVAAASLVVLVVPFLLTLVMVEDRSEPLLRADLGARDSLHQFALSHPGFVAAMQLVSDSGSALAWVVVLAAVVGWLLWRRLPLLALFVVITAAGSSVLNAGVKMAADRMRPALTHPVAREQGLSFPSAHAQAAVVGYALLLLVFLPVLVGAWRRAAIALAVVAVLAIGFSRVALGVHFVSDVVGGYVLGAAWVAAMAAAFNVMEVQRGRHPHHASPRSAAGS